MQTKHIRNFFICLCCPKLSLLLQLFQKYRERHAKRRKMQLSARVGLASGIIMTCVAIFGFVAFPNLIKSKIKTMVTLKAGLELRDMFMKLPFPLTFKIYTFNLTNPRDVVNGATPILQEIGPYYFDEWREKELVQENEADDTMSYRSKESFIFRPDLSGGLTGNEFITIPHPLIVSIALTVAREKPAMLTLVSKALNSIFKNPETPFLTATVNQIFFDGVIINCSVTDFAGKAVCTQLKTEAKELQVVAENVFKFSLMGAKNDSFSNKFKVKRGLKDYRDTGRVLEHNDKPELTIWGSKECNQFQGTDGTIFPALIKAGSDIPSYAPALCRVIAAKFDKKVKYDGIPVSRYTATMGDQTGDPSEKCYCPAPGECLKKGALDLRKCAGPVVATMPHFYGSDPEYINGVRGISPEKEKHELYILFETMSGSPVSARNRLQFNLPLMKIPKMTFMKDVPEVLVPLFWVEESIDLNRTLTKPIKMLFVTKKVVKIATWLVIAASLGGLGYAAYIYTKTSNEVEITAVKKAAEKKNSTISMVLGSEKGVENPTMSDNEIHKY